MRSTYGEDLAYIHDVGFGGYASGAAPGMLRMLQNCGVKAGLVVDLGCGSGILAQALTRSGYQVLGVDASSAMIRLARQRVPQGKFVRQSLHTVSLPPCAAVTAIGESLNYLSSSRAKGGLDAIIRKVFGVLPPGGCFIFDLAEPSLALAEHNTKSFAEGSDWSVLVEKQADRSHRLLTRHIVVFRRIGKLYRRTEEVHQLRLYERTEVRSMLEAAGLRARVLHRFGKQSMLPGRVGFLAVKPKS